MKDKLRITFAAPFTVKTGGIAVVLEYCLQLKRMGHKVNIVYPLIPYRELEFHESHDLPARKKLRIWLRHIRINFRNFVRRISLFSENIPVKPLIKICDLLMPNADAVIATAWPTAYDVSKLSPKKGRKFYLVQGYEIWHGYRERVDNSYSLPLNIITVAPWLTEILKEKIGRNDVTEIHNGIRLDKFYPPAVKNFDRASILFQASELELKGTLDAIDAMIIVKERFPQLEVTMFGMHPRPSAPFEFEYHQNPPYEKLLSLYQNASVFIFPSHGEGWGLTPIEAMACECALVATDVGCIPIIGNGENMIPAEVKNPRSIADGVMKLLDDKALAGRIAARGLETVREMGWDKSAQKFISALQAGN